MSLRAATRLLLTTVLAAAATTLVTCRCQRPAPQPAPSTIETPAFTLHRVELPRPDLHGLSGATVDGDGTLWVVPERQRLLVPLASYTGARVGSDVLIRGIPEGYDTESIAWLDKRRFALGTESEEERDRDLILIVDAEGGAATVRARIEIAYAPWDVTPVPNQGLEGLCRVGSSLYLASESVGEVGDMRFAPVARYDLETQTLTYGRLWLTTATGKVSSIDCRLTESGIELLAIERHYGVGRLVVAPWPTARANPDVPTVLLDLAPLFDPLPNFEGLVWYEDGTIFLLTDNDAGGITGPSEIVLITPRGRPVPELDLTP